MTTTITVECCNCGKHLHTKDGEGLTGTSSSVCEPCAYDLLPPHLHDEFRRRKELEREGFTVSADRVSMGRVWA